MKMMRFMLIFLLSANTLFSFTKKEYGNYDQFAARYFLNALYYEHVGSAERSEENLRIAYLKSNSDVLKLNLSVRNLISGKKDEGYAALKELYDSGHNLGRFGIYLYLSLKKGDPQTYDLLDRVINDLNKLGETETAAEVIRQKMTDRMYLFENADDFIDFYNEIYPDELSRNYEYFFKSVMVQIQSRIKKDNSAVKKMIDELEDRHGELPYLFYRIAFSGYLENKDLEKAKLVLDKMVRYNYGEPGYYYDRATYYAEADKLDTARNILLEGIRLSKDTTLRMKLGSVYLSLKDLERAGKVFDDIVSDNPESDMIREMISNEYAKSGYEDEAVLFFEKALEKFPDDPELLNNYSYLLAEKGTELEKALEMADKAVKLKETSITFLDTKAWALFRLDRYDEAEKIMDAIFADEESYYHQSSEELFDHYVEIKKALNKTEDLANISINRTAVILADIILQSSYLLQAGF